MRDRIVRVALAALACAVVAGRADRATAGLVTYTETVTAQGSLGQVNFNSIAVSLTADTTGITQSGAEHYTAQVTTATVTANGLTATFLDPVFFDAGRSFGGFNRVVPGTGGATQTILDIQNPQFTNYGLATPLGPLLGPPGEGPGLFETDLGELTIGMTFGNATFTATPLSVPEPPSLALGGVAGLMALAGARSRRRRAGDRPIAGG